MKTGTFYIKILIGVYILTNLNIYAEDGYELWLRYKSIENKEIKNEYSAYLKNIKLTGNSETINAIQYELTLACKGLLHFTPEYNNKDKAQHLIIGLSESFTDKFENGITNQLGEEGFAIKKLKNGKVYIVSNSETGLLYGVFRFVRLLQQEVSLKEIEFIDFPKTKLRLLNHWDNLNRTVERGYAGHSIWDWHKLPDYISPRYKDYARANASIGINGTVLTNVNADALVLTETYLHKVKALADVFRPYGIKVYLTARFSAPIEIGGLETADPLNPEVVKWWENKAREIYSIIPDFGGFLVKANSEGQPGPQDYNRSHAEGANMLASAMAPFGGIIMWRAFVYSHKTPDDRANQAYNEFKPLDGKFEPNVMVQVKNGAIDFQPREPFHPLFGAMKNTPLMMEFQITQEYLGCATHLVYLGTLYEDILKSDTYAKGENSEVYKVIDGSLHNYTITGMAGVSNIGSDRNWTGHPFAQANWYAYGRLAWNPELRSEQIADEWIRMTFTNNTEFISIVKPLMLNSHETAVNYMTPLGLHHQMAAGHHWGPGPWVDYLGRDDWNSTYYHKASKNGVGFNRSTSGSKHVNQYFPVVKNIFNNPESCPEKYLLWFHHLPWDYTLKSGKSLWDGLCEKYYLGTRQSREMLKSWQKTKSYIDDERYDHVYRLLKIQVKESIWWRNAMLLYFQQYSLKPIPVKYEKPDHDLEYYKNLQFQYVPGINGVN